MRSADNFTLSQNKRVRFIKNKLSLLLGLFFITLFLILAIIIGADLDHYTNLDNSTNLFIIGLTSFSLIASLISFGFYIVKKLKSK